MARGSVESPWREQLRSCTLKEQQWVWAAVETDDIRGGIRDKASLCVEWRLGELQGNVRVQGYINDALRDHLS